MVNNTRGPLKVALLFPPADERYAKRVTGYSRRPSPPQTAHAVLGAWLKAYSIQDVLVESLSDQTPSGEERLPREFTEFSGDADIVGITCWYHNLGNALSLAGMIKEQNPEARIILGGPGVSNPQAAKLALRHQQAVDYVVEGDGEDALLGVVECHPAGEIPNLWHRENGDICFTYHKNTDLSRMPLWDFSGTKDHEGLLEAHKSLYEKEQSMVGIFSNRGCPKANRSGPCIFCSSNTGGAGVRALAPETFWEQRRTLYDAHGIRDAYCADNVFPLSLGYVKRIVQAQEDVNNKLRMRVYAYPTDIMKKGGPALADAMRKAGVYNVLFGVESFDGQVNRSANKDAFELGCLKEAIGILRSAGINTTLSFIIGLPGESAASLHATTAAFASLMRKFGADCLTRVYLSLGMPLIGTSWYGKILSDKDVSSAYRKATGIHVGDDITPRYDILRKLSLKRFTSVTGGDVFESMKKLIAIARDFLPEENIGGYGLEELAD